MRISKRSDSDYVWSQLLTPGMDILTDADVLEVVAVETVAETDAHGNYVECVSCTLCSLDGSTFDRTYPMDHLVPTIPRQFGVAA